MEPQNSYVPKVDHKRPEKDVLKQKNNQNKTHRLEVAGNLIIVVVEIVIVTWDMR
jgi:hypothetical protein